MLVAVRSIDQVVTAGDPLEYCQLTVGELSSSSHDASSTNRSEPPQYASSKSTRSMNKQGAGHGSRRLIQVGERQP